MNDEDIHWVKECIAGNTRSFEAIVEKYYKHIFNAVLRIINKYDDAEDITQSVFIKAFENLGAFNERYKFFSWIYRIAVNESINWLNQRRRFERLEGDVLLSAEKSPEESCYADEISRDVQDALMNLQLDHRLVIVLKHLQGLSYEEVAFILDVSEKTVKSRLFSARNALREAMLKKGFKYEQ